MDISGEFTTTVNDIDLKEHEVIVRYKGYYIPAIIGGPPENCYPAEGEINLEIDFPSGVEFNLDDLQDYLEQKAWEHYDGRF